MNSVLQQLYMIPQIRNGILSTEGAVNELDASEDDISVFHSPPSVGHQLLTAG